MSPSDDGLFGEELRGTVSRIVYSNPDSGWAVVRLDREGGGGEATVVGPLVPVYEGQSLRVEGEWETDEKYGEQFRATAATVERPESVAGIRRYLASGAVSGVGPEIARRMVERFDGRTLEVIDEDPRRLLEVRGIGPKRLEMIRESWSSQAAERSAQIFLQGFGLGPALARRIVKAWGEETEERVRREPYALADEVSGVGFRTADALAREMGWEVDALPRARAGLLYVLRQASDDGHCFVVYDDLVRRARELLRLDEDEVVRRAVAGMIADGALVAEPLDDEEVARLGVGGDEGTVRAVYERSLHRAECRVSERLATIAGAAAAVAVEGDDPEARIRRAVEWVEGELGASLGGDQREAVRRALAEKVLLVTGGPGTGKTTLIDAIVRCIRVLEGRVELAAPTGRAAKRLSQATGHEARTIHRLLEYRYGEGFTRDLDHPIDADLLVVDEASMIDLRLMDALLSAVPDGCRTVLVGDADQLPPVGPGAVLRDLLESSALPTVRLTEIFRQAGRSLIVDNAHRINAGEMPRGLKRDDDGSIADRDFFYVDESDPVRARRLVVSMVERRIPDRFSLDPVEEVQVLSPMHRGECGVGRLNETLQATLNPRGPSVEVGGTTFREGDRVIQQRNDYDRDVFNGDVGRVRRVRDGGGLDVEFDDRVVGYDADACRDLALAYAISIHKSQGSEYPCVIVVLLPEHYIMLQRNLLYTAITRAQRLAVIVSTLSTVAQAVRNAAPAARCTRLSIRLRKRMADAREPGCREGSS